MRVADPIGMEAAQHTGDNPIPPFLVAPSRRAAADWGAKRATELLGGPQVLVTKWFRASAETADVLGAAAAGPDIYVRNDLSLADTVVVASHEAAHAFGEIDEAKCEAVQRQVHAEWVQHRSRQRDVLTKRFETMRERWEAMEPDCGPGPKRDAQISKRLDQLCMSFGVGAFQHALALEELNLLADELDSPSPASPDAYRNLPGSKPPAPTWSFSR